MLVQELALPSTPEIKLEFYLRSESENNGPVRSPSCVLVILNHRLQKQDRRHRNETV
jgi:hypothetical protein